MIWIALGGLTVATIINRLALMCHKRSIEDLAKSLVHTNDMLIRLIGNTKPLGGGEGTGPTKR